MMQNVSLLLRNVKQLVRFVPSGAGKRQWRLETLSNISIAIDQEKILSVDHEENIRNKYYLHPGTHIIDASNFVVTPGLIDPHTHPVFYLTRETEFEMRILGKSYEEIAAAGGGIRNSVKAVRQASKEELKAKVKPRLRRFLELATTTIEAKSGYGLTFADEVKSLEVLFELNREQELEIIPTFLGAHEIPDEYRQNRDEYIRLLIQEMIPYVAKHQLAEFCDIFCEQNVYSVDEARKILNAAKSSGLNARLHADQLHLTGATQLAVEVGAVSADHLEQLDDASIHKIAQSDTVAGLLPGAVFFLGSTNYPPARKLIDAGATVCLATDFNPGSSMTQSMPLMMTLACLFMKMTPAEALTASTIGAAAALQREDKIGNIEQNYQADLVLWDADHYKQIPYYYGVNLVRTVIKKGKVVIDKNL